LAFRPQAPALSAESGRRGSRGGAWSAHHHGAHDRADAHLIRELLGRQLYRRAGRRLFQAVHRLDRHPDPHRHAGILCEDQGAGASRPLRIRHDVDQWLRASREGLAEPIDWTIFKKGTLPAEAIVANGHGVASNIQGTNLCYRRDKFPNGGPRSWADFWDVEKFPGARGLCINDSPRTLIFALLADGVPPDRLYPLDIDRAFKKLDQLKPHIKVWWREGNQSQQLIRDGELDMMSIWNGRASELKEAGVPVELVWNGAVRSTSTWCVLKGAPNRKLAWEFIQFATQPKPQAEFNRRLYYGPTNPAAFEFIPHDIAVVLPTYNENLAVSIREDDEWEADRIVALEERFTQWLAS